MSIETLKTAIKIKELHLGLCFLSEWKRKQEEEELQGLKEQLKELQNVVK